MSKITTFFARGSSEDENARTVAATTEQSLITASSTSTTQPLAYEARWKRKFVLPWNTAFPWIEYRKEQDAMFCSECTQFPNLADKTSTLFIGDSKFRKPTLYSHDKSRAHIVCHEALHMRRHPENAPLERQLHRMNETVASKLTKLLTLRISLLKRNSHLHYFLNSLSYTRRMKLNLGYFNDNPCRNFISAIA